MTTTPSSLKICYDKLLTLPHNLLTAEPADMTKYKMLWAPATWFKNEKHEKTKGMWTDGVRTSPVFPLWGVIDGKKSQLGDYGNCWYDKETSSLPSRSALSKSKFSVHITYPKLAEKHPDEPYAQSVSNQIYCLDAIQDNTMAALAAAGEGDASTGDWAHFEQSDDGTVGWLQASIGSVYESKSRKVKGNTVTNRSPVKAPASDAVDKPDIVDDTLGFLARTPNHNLKHNELLPCFLPNGERIGRCSSELRRELYDGRWVRLDVELIMWNMKSDGKRIFQLQVLRLEVLPAPAASMNGVVYASLDPRDYKAIGPSPPAKGDAEVPADKAAPPAKGDAEVPADKPAPAVQGTVEVSAEKEGDDTDTFSESSDKSKHKRTANNQGGRPSKKSS